MRISTTKSKYSESFYITKSYINNHGKSTSKIIRKLGTLNELSERLGTDRDGVMAWAKEQAKLETEKYKNEKCEIVIPFHSDRQLDYHRQKFFEGGYLFLQFIYYSLKLDCICRKIKRKHKLNYDLNAILSHLIYAKILEPLSNCFSLETVQKYLEPPSYQLADVSRALPVLAEECGYIQSEVYKNSILSGKRDDETICFDHTDVSFGIEHGKNDKAIFLICFLSHLICRILEQRLNNKYSRKEILETLKGMNFADIEEQGYMPLYNRTKLTDGLHNICGFRTDYQFISKSKMREIKKRSKGR